MNETVPLNVLVLNSSKLLKDRFSKGGSDVLVKYLRHIYHHHNYDYVSTISAINNILYLFSETMKYKAKTNEDTKLLKLNAKFVVTYEYDIRFARLLFKHFKNNHYKSTISLEEKYLGRVMYSLISHTRKLFQKVND